MHNGSEWLHRLKNNARVKEEIKYRVFFSKHIKGTDHKIQDMIYVLEPDRKLLLSDFSDL